MASRVHNLARVGAVAGASAALLLAAAMPAGADDTTTGKLLPGGDEGYQVNLEGQGHGSVQTVLFQMQSEQAKLRAYCVELKTSVKPDHPDMTEVGWDKYPDQASPFNANRGKIKWVLQHSYPAMDTNAIAAELQGVQLKDGLSSKEAITATQAAVWNLSDGANLDQHNPIQGQDDAKADVLALYNFLLKNAQDIQEPTPGLTITPGSATGQIGKKIGPFKVGTTANAVELASQLPEGVKLVDDKGSEVQAKDLKNGSQFFVDVPSSAKPGEGTVTLNAVADLSAGRLFIGKDYKQYPTQSMILAKSENTKLTAGAKASWTAATAPTTSSSPQVPVKIPAGDNPNVAAAADSGPGATPFILGGGALVLLAGGGLALNARRRKLAEAIRSTSED
jgi:TQXA domain-containing protein